MLDMMGCGMAIFAECVLIANFKVLVLASLSTLGLKLLVGFGIIIFYVCSVLEEMVFPFGEMSNTVRQQMESVNYWAVVAGCVGVVMMVEVIFARY
jgi:hypothetical protein